MELHVNQLISLILFLIASKCNAVMDTLSHHFSTSLFKDLNKQFWDPSVSWLNKYQFGNPALGRKKIFWKINYPVQISDAWHLFKTIMILCIVGSIVLYRPWLGWWDIIIYGLIWNYGFSLFYNIKPKKK